MLEAAEADNSDDLAPVGRGQVRQITAEVEQDRTDAALFRVAGKDKSWFLQKGGIVFERSNPSRFYVDVVFEGGVLSRFGDEYAEISRAQQLATINWLLMVGVAKSDYDLTGYRDCKTSGFYFLFHLNYRRTRWRIIGCPHNCELEDADGRLYTCDPQESGQFEHPAYEGQVLTVAFEGGELWLVDNGVRVLRGLWGLSPDGTDAAEVSPRGQLPAGEYFPAVLTPNCPTAFRAVCS